MCDNDFSQDVVGFMREKTSIPSIARDYRCFVDTVTGQCLLMTYCTTVLIRVLMTAAEAAAIDTYCM